MNDLYFNTQERSSDLLILRDQPHRALKDIITKCGEGQAPVNAVVYQKEVTFEEVNLEDKIKELCESKNIKVFNSKYNI